MADEIALASGDVLVALLAAQRGMVDPGALDGLTDEVLASKARGRTTSLLGLMVDKGLLTSGQAADLKKARAEQARMCVTCSHTTYLLPGETVDTRTCEKCKRLLSGAKAGETATPSGRVVAPAAVSDRIPGPPPPATGRAAQSGARPSGAGPTGAVAASAKPAATVPPEMAATVLEPPPGAPAAPPSGADPRFAPPATGPRAAPTAVGRPSGRHQGPPAPFWAQLGEILAFPVASGGGLTMLAMASLLGLLLYEGFGWGLTTMAVNPVIGGPMLVLIGGAMLPTTGYLWSYLARVTTAGVRGERELPDFPEFALADQFQMALRVIGVVLACYWPILVVVLAAVMAKAPLLLLAALPCALLGALYWPIAWLLTASFQNGALAWQYPAGLRAIGSAPGDYLLLILIQVIVGTLTGAVSVAAGLGLPAVLVDLVIVVLTTYQLMVTALATGRFYWANHSRLQWFATPEPAPEAAHDPRFGPPAVQPAGPRGPITSGVAVHRSARGESMSRDMLKQDALGMIRHPATIAALIAVALLLVVKSVAHKDWYVTQLEASDAARKRQVPLVVWRHGTGDSRNEDLRKSVLLDPRVQKLDFVIYDHEVPGSPHGSIPEWGSLSVFDAKDPALQVDYMRTEVVPTPDQLIAALQKAGAR